MQANPGGGFVGTVNRCKTTILIFAVFELVVSLAIISCCIAEPVMTMSEMSESSDPSKTSHLADAHEAISTAFYLAGYHSIGIACGIFGIVSSGLGIAAVCHPKKGLTVAHMAVCILTALVCFVTFAIATFWAAIASLELTGGSDPQLIKDHWVLAKRHYKTGAIFVLSASLVLMVLLIVSTSVLCSKCGGRSDDDFVAMPPFGQQPLFMVQGTPGQYHLAQQGPPMMHVETAQQPVVVGSAGPKEVLGVAKDKPPA